jgi:hypothetical protein
MLHHYCSLDSFMGIVQTRSIWAGDSRFLNDSTELKESKRVLYESMEMISGAIGALPSSKGVIEAIESVCSQNHMIFVASFSAEEDDLSQWRCYADRGRGVRLSFNETLLRELPYRIGSVIYGAPQLVDSAIALAETYARIPKLAGADLQALTRQLVDLTALAKHDAFRGEREARMLARADEYPEAVSFRRSGLFVTSYKVIPLDSIWKRGVLEEVCVGPNQHDSETARSVIEFLKAKSLGKTLVHRSTAPFREW